MEILLTILLAAGSLFLLYLLAWRILSQFFTLPCPPGYIFLLESPLINRVAGPQALIRRAGIQPGMRVLDAGCGPGRITIPVAELLRESGHVTAFDMQERMLKILKQRLEDRGLENVTILQGQFGEGALPKAHFERAFLVSVLGEVPDQAGALMEIYHALVPGGILSVTEVLPDPHYLSPRKVQRLGEEIGFQPKLISRDWRSHTLNLIKSVE